MSVDFDHDITDYVASALLRYYRKGSIAQSESPRIDSSIHLDQLRLHWSLSTPVQTFLSYFISHRHEAQGLLRSGLRMGDNLARGRIDACRTLLARRLSGNPSIVVWEEIVRSFDTGPNQVVAWVVHAVSAYISRFAMLHHSGSSHTLLIEDSVTAVSSIKRLESLREPLRSVIIHRRPRRGQLRDAARSRRLLYRLAVSAYESLAAIERGDEEALRNVLYNTLIAPLENWRRFELAVALGIAEAISAELGHPMQFSIIDNHSGGPIITCHHYAIFWQSDGGLYREPPLEPSEVRQRTLVGAYGINFGRDRPDLIVVDQIARKVCAIVEVKYVSGDTANARFRDAAGQIVRYARGYSRKAEIDKLIRQSLIVLSSQAPSLSHHCVVAPLTADFRGLRHGHLQYWVRERLLTVHPSSTGSGNEELRNS